MDFQHGINTAVNKVRQAFGDDAENPRFIETLPRIGYRFIARVDVVGANGTGSELGMQPLSYPQGKPPAGYLRKRRRLAPVAGALVALLAIAALALFSSSFSGRHTDEPRKL